MPQYPPPVEDETGQFNPDQADPMDEEAYKSFQEVFPEWDKDYSKQFAATPEGREAADAIGNGDYGKAEQLYNDAFPGANKTAPDRFQEPKTETPIPRPLPNKPFNPTPAQPRQFIPDPALPQVDAQAEDNIAPGAPSLTTPPGAEPDLAALVQQLQGQQAPGGELGDMLQRRSGVDPSEFYKFLSSGVTPRAMVDSMKAGAIGQGPMKQAYQKYITDKDNDPMAEG